MKIARHILGAAVGEPAIVIRLKDVGGLVKSKSAAGGLLYNLTPGTMSTIVYGQMRDKLAGGLKDEGVDADVQITTSPPSGPPPKSEFGRGAALGVVAAAGGWALFRYVIGPLVHKKRRR